MHIITSQLQPSAPDARRTRRHVLRTLCVLSTAFVFIAAATVGSVYAGPSASPSPTETPSLPGGTKSDKKVMDGTEKQGNNAGRNDNTKPTGSQTTKKK